MFSRETTLSGPFRARHLFCDRVPGALEDELAAGLVSFAHFRAKGPSMATLIGPFARGFIHQDRIMQIPRAKAR